MKSALMVAIFPATRWSVVAAAGAGDEGSRAALAELCQLYWYPLYAFARRSGLKPEDAEDATQGFFASILKANLFATADPSKGRLRSFLLKSFTYDLADAGRRAARQKRGGDVEMVSFDLEMAEDRYNLERSGQEPVYQFESAWAATVLEQALRTVQAHYVSTGRGELFEALRPCLGNTSAGVASAGSLGMSEVALRQAISRLRDRFRTALRAQIADTLREPTEEAINEELNSLRSALSAS